MRSQDIFMTDKTAKTTIIVIGPVTKSVIERFGQTATGQTARIATTASTRNDHCEWKYAFDRKPLKQAI